MHPIPRRSRPRFGALAAAAVALAALALPALAAGGVTAPSLETEITAVPSSPRFDPEGSFRFRSPGAVSEVSFQCRLDGKRWHACKSPTGPIRLGRGTHRFEVRATGPGGAADPTPASARVRVLERKVEFGKSAEGRKLVAVRFGEAGARRKALMVGEIHGDEPEGREIVERLRTKYAGLDGVEVWSVISVNPDGHARHTRKNAHGVDLNRNFSVGWSGAEPPSSGYYAGPHPFSEPESRAVKRLAKRIRPRVSIYWHQPWNRVLVPCHGKAKVQRRYARIAGERTSCRGHDAPGTAIDWQNRKLPGLAFVVELGAGELGDGELRRHARAAAAVARG